MERTGSTQSPKMGRPKVTPSVQRRGRTTLTSKTHPKEIRGRKPIGNTATTPLRARKRKLALDKRTGNSLEKL